MALIERLAATAYRSCLAGDTFVTRQLGARPRAIGRLTFGMALALYPLLVGFSWGGIVVRKLMRKPPRIFWGPTPILTIAESSRLLNRLGFPSRTLVFTTYHIQTAFDIDLSGPVANPSVGYWLPNLLFLWSLLRFDIFHFFYDGGLWSGMNILPDARWLELPLLRLAGKRVIASAYGADVRVRSINELWQPYNICHECPEPGKFCVCDESGLVRAKYYGDWCNETLAMGDMHDFVAGSRLDFKYWPVDVATIRFAGTLAHDAPLRVVHAPNHRYFKGTRFLERAVDALRAEGHEIELDLVEGVSNAEAKRRYEAADIVFAQCLAGWIGYTELEALASGKPVLTYIRDPAYLDCAPGCPVVAVTPDTLETSLRTLIADPELRERLGRQGREYVEKEWSYDALAPAYRRLHTEVWRHNRLGATMRKKFADIRHGDISYRRGSAVVGARLSELPVYPDPELGQIRLEAGLCGQPPFDEHGLPRVYYEGMYVESPEAVARVGLNAFHLALRSGGSDAVGQFRVAAEWLRDHLQVDREGVGRWFHHFDVRERDLSIPWVSCLSQSLGLSTLLRAEQAYPGERFVDSATAAAELFRVATSNDGILYSADGSSYLEGYPELEPAHVLDQWITGTFGLHEYWRARREAWAEELFHDCVSTLVSKLDEYEGANGVRYDLRSEAVASHRSWYFLIQQLCGLHTLTGDAGFERRARRWRRQLYRVRLGNFSRLQAPI